MNLKKNFSFIFFLTEIFSFHDFFSCEIFFMKILFIHRQIFINLEKRKRRKVVKRNTSFTFFTQNQLTPPVYTPHPLPPLHLICFSFISF